MYAKATLSGDYNGDGKNDIACLINDKANNKGRPEVFENPNKLSFSKKTTSYPTATILIYCVIKLDTSGLINADNKTDIVLCYDHIGLGSQIMFVYESTDSFCSLQNLF